MRVITPGRVHLRRGMLHAAFWYQEKEFGMEVEPVLRRAATWGLIADAFDIKNASHVVDACWFMMREIEMASARPTSSSRTTPCRCCSKWHSQAELTRVHYLCPKHAMARHISRTTRVVSRPSTRWPHRLAIKRPHHYDEGNGPIRRPRRQGVGSTVPRPTAFRSPRSSYLHGGRPRL